VALLALLCVGGAQGQTLNVPPRPASAPTGSQFVNIITPMPLTERENWIYAQVASGNVPGFLRTLVPVAVSGSVSGTNHTGTYYAAPDYVAIGTDTNYFLEPMTPLLGQRLCTLLGCTLPTRKMVNQIWTNAGVKMTPQTIPPSPEMITVPVFADHNDLVWSQRSTNPLPLGALVSGDKKDVIISTKIYTNFVNGGPTKPVVIYGWHYTSGVPIQPLYNGHEETYADYSHGIRLVQNAFTLDGNPNTITNVLPNPNLAGLLSDEGSSEGTTSGVIQVPRYTVAAVAPVIITHPRSQTVVPGSSAVFQVLAAGDPPLSYAWKSNGVAIPGATNASLALSNVQVANAASYSVTVSNNSGSATSRAAWLRVNTNAHPILFADNFDTDSSANWNFFWGAANGLPDYTVDWAFDYGATPYTFNGVTALIPPAPNSPDGSTRGVRFTVNNNDTNGSTAGVNIYPKNQTFSNNFALKFDLWINYPGGASGVNATGSTEHAIFGLNHLGTQVNWAAPSGSASDGVWFAVDGEGGTTHDYRAYVGDPSGPPTELIGQAASGLSQTDNVAAIYQTLLPSSRFETAGAAGKNWVEAELRQTNNVILWLLDGTVIAQRTNTSSFTAGNIMLGFMDTFASIANPAEDAFVIFDNVRVEDLSTGSLQAPAITAQPQSQTIVAGANVAFTVTASGSAPLSYQWRFKGTNVPGAAGSSLMLTNIQASAAGPYDVVVSNAAGVVTSDAATLTVTAADVRFLSVAMLANREVQLVFSGAAGQDYVIEASPNLVGWAPVWLLTGSNGPLSFIDPGATSLSRRFYRARAAAAQTLTDFEAFASGTTVLFQKPSYSGSTSNLLNAAPNFAYVTNSFPGGHAGAKALCAAWDFKTGTSNPWLRLTSNNATNLPNPTISTNQVVQFDVYADRDLYVVVGFRETSTSAAIGADGGTSGAIEWIGGTTDNTMSPPKGRFVSAGQWTTLNFFIPYEPVRGFTGNGVLESSTGKGVLEHLGLVPAGGLGTYNLYLDNFRVIELGP
jgi:hypothetical protein